MIRKKRLGWRAAALALALAAGGCAYKIEIEQGDAALLEQLDQLRVGMSLEEVETLLRRLPTPQLFRENTRIYTYQRREAGFVDNMRVRSVQLLFDNNGILQEITPLRDDFADEFSAETDDAQDAADESGTQDADDASGAENADEAGADESGDS